MSAIEKLARTLSLIMVLAFGAVGLTGCEDEGPMEEVGEDMDEAGEEFGDQMDEAEDDLN